MRSWKRVPSTTLCGGCRHRQIQQDEAALYIRIPGVKREMVRCQDCAGEAPPDLPKNMVPGGIQPSKTGFSRVGRSDLGKTRGDVRALLEKYSPHNS